MSNVKALRTGVNPYPHVETWSWAGILLLIGIGIASRLPFQSMILHHWDSVNFALALEQYDLRLHQPHPPGMFVFYILLGRLFNLFLVDANTSLVWVSLLASGLATVAIYLLGKTWFDTRTAVVITLFMLTSPLVWFHSEVALSYMLEFFWVLLIVFACFYARAGDLRVLLLAALLVGLAGGIRPNTPVFMFPLWSVAVGLAWWERKFTIGQIILALSVMALGVTLWAVPLVIMSGGPLAYWEQFEWWRAQHLEDSGSSEGLFLHVARMGMFTMYGVGAGLIAVAWAFLLHWRTLLHNLRHDWRTQTIALWVTPALLYFIVIHIRQPGHTFTLMPGFMVIAGVSVVLAGRSLERFHRHAPAVLSGLIIGGNALFFLAGPANLFGSSRLIFSAPTWATIREYDNLVTERLTAIRSEFAPEETAIFATSRNFRLPDFYLPAYHNISHAEPADDGTILVPQELRTIVLFDDQTLPELRVGGNIQQLSLPGGDTLRYITREANQPLTLHKTTSE